MTNHEGLYDAFNFSIGSLWRCSRSSLITKVISVVKHVSGVMPRGYAQGHGPSENQARKKREVQRYQWNSSNSESAEGCLTPSCFLFSFRI